MPTLISRGAASARAFGFTGSSKGQLYTQVFTSNGTFTPIPGVTNLVTLVGQGGSSTSDYQTSGTAFSASTYYNLGGTGANPPPLYWSDLAQGIIDAAAQMNTGGDQTGYSFLVGSWETYAGDTWTPLTYLSDLPYYTVAGTWSVSNGGAAPWPPSGTVGSGSASNGGYYASGSWIAPGTSGSGSSALGYFFSGASQVGSYPNATGQAANPSTYNNIAVTPGTNYPIVVGAGGYVAISYIIP